MLAPSLVQDENISKKNTTEISLYKIACLPSPIEGVLITNQA